MRVIRASCICTYVIVLLASMSFAPIPYAFESSNYTSILQHLDAERAWTTVDQLAGDAYAGRRSGTQGAVLASEYVADYFASIGLKPAGTDSSYLTKFTVPLWELRQVPSVALVDQNGRSARTFAYRKDFNVIPGSGYGDYSAEVIFGGYGITAENLGYDDYAGISARGKIVLAIVGAPPTDKLKQDDYAAPYAKAENALSHGAVGLILVDTPALPTPEYIQRSRCGCCWTIFQGITILGGSIQLVDTLLEGSGATLSSTQATIDHELTPRSFTLGKWLHVSVNASFIQDATAYNVLGFIPGSDPEASRKVVIVGAHYDHWGKDVDGSIFRGANDDASGVAVVMELARLFSSWAKPRWSILFAAWSGEEEGFYGSYAYAARPHFSITGTIAYLNLDMVGYGQPLLGEISQFNTSLRVVIVESSEHLNISLHFEDYQGGSDTVVFQERKVPNAMFIYWPDAAYHTPADTASHVSKSNLLETARLTGLIALKLTEAVISPTTLGKTTTEAQQSTPAILSINAVIVSVVTLVATAAIVTFYLQSRKK